MANNMNRARKEDTTAARMGAERQGHRAELCCAARGRLNVFFFSFSLSSLSLCFFPYGCLGTAGKILLFSRRDFSVFLYQGFEHVPLMAFPFPPY